MYNSYILAWVHSQQLLHDCLPQDGEIVYVDWMPAKDQESGKIQSKISGLC